MPIKISGNHFKNCEVGVSAPASSDLDIGSNRFVSCGKAIDLRNPSSLVEAIGLQSDTPMHLLREVFAFAAVSLRSESEIREKSESLGLFKWISAGADASTLVSAIASLYHHVPAILAALPK